MLQGGISNKLEMDKRMKRGEEQIGHIIWSLDTTPIYSDLMEAQGVSNILPHLTVLFNISLVHIQ